MSPNYPDEPALAEEFKRTVAAALEAGMSESDIAHYFGASKVTVRKWRDGLNHPHPAIMRHAITDLRTEAAKKKAPK